MRPTGPGHAHGPVVRVLGLVLVLALLATGCSGSDGSDETGDGPNSSLDPDAPLRITTVSGPPEYVTGGDAVVAVDSPAGLPLDQVVVTAADGTDLTDRFAPDPRPHGPGNAPERLVATITDLPAGDTTLTASVEGQSAAVTLTDHDTAGPLFSGPHQSPFVCTTGKTGLGAPGDECGAAATFSWQYWSTDGQLLDLPAGPTLPDDVDTVTTAAGAQVPFVVRLERTVLNRSITTIAVLDPQPGGGDPAASPPAWDSSGWNGRLVLRFGGGCGTTYSQGTPSPNVLDKDLLGAGYALTNGSLTSFETSCNATVAAETAMVAKEHFVEAYGIPRHTIGEGGSGGAIQQLQIVQNYPGVIDAIAPSAPFPDAVSIAAGASDCGLLERWFGRDGGSAGIIPDGLPSGSDLTATQQMAITGFASVLTCAFWTRAYLETLDPSEGCDSALLTQVWDLAVRPRGVRCTFQDSNVNVLGTDPETGYANRPLDNEGVQYGLQAVRDGSLSVDEFLDLNEHIGGFDVNGAWQSQRTRATDAALSRAYQGGMVTAGTASQESGALGSAQSGGLADVPVILLNAYTDPLGDIHDRQRAFAVRSRLRDADGSEDVNLSIWTISAGDGLSALANLISGGSLDADQPVVPVLDRWLTAAEDGPSSGTWAERLAAARPADAEDRCVLPTGDVRSGAGIYDEGSDCSVAYPVHSDPRQVAGAPLVNDTLACTLVPIDPDAYGTELSDAQLDRLDRIFPSGVCDWNRSGREQQPPREPWQRHDGP